MPESLSYVEIQIIHSFMESKPVSVIADIIEKPESVIKEKISEIIAGDSTRSSYDRIHKKKEDKKNLDKVNHRNYRDQLAMAKRRSVTVGVASDRKNGSINSASKYKTKKVDYTKMKMVRINSKTSIMIPENDDAEKAKEKFLKNYGIK